MCGRYSQLRSWSDLVRLYNITADQTPLNLPPRYNIAPTQDVPVVRSTREGGSTGASAARRWACAVLGKGRRGRLQDDQRARRDDRREAGVPRGLPTAAVPGRRRRFLRMGKDANRPQAAVFHHRRGRSALRLRGPLGNLEQPRRRKDRDLHDCRHPGERDGPADSRPDAGHPRWRSLRCHGWTRRRRLPKPRHCSGRTPAR